MECFRGGAGLTAPEELMKALPGGQRHRGFVEASLERHLIDGNPSKFHVIEAAEAPRRFQRWYHQNVNSRGQVPKASSESLKATLGDQKTFNWDKASTYVERLGYDLPQKKGFKGYPGWKWTENLSG
jgi:hypothetical protein